MSVSNKNKGFTRDQINKIGNAIIYLSENVPDLNKTKILKILFLIEEASIKKYGHPFFGINFQLWKLGPVVKDIFIDLSDEMPVLLKDFIERDSKNSFNFKSKSKFCDDEFSDNDIELMKLVVDFAKTKTASYLVQHTHGPNSLWRKSALKFGVLEVLEKELINSTEFEIDFDLLFADRPHMKERFEEVRENMEFVRQLKN
ncbi:MAG TPA: Panacea domain-containing protein [Puia sp.]|nr:Panacea domain-containing protein [Puia sp.]